MYTHVLSVCLNMYSVVFLILKRLRNTSRVHRVISMTRVLTVELCTVRTVVQVSREIVCKHKNRGVFFEIRCRKVLPLKSMCASWRHARRTNVPRKNYVGVIDRHEIRITIELEKPTGNSKPVGHEVERNSARDPKHL